MDNTSNHRLNHRGNNESPAVQKLKQLFYEFTNLPIKEDENNINIGYTFPFDNQDFVIHLFDKWVAHKEMVLDRMEEGTNDFAQVFSQRAFTLGEYKLVISGKVSEEHYKDYRVFDYLYLTNKAERDYFTGINTRNESEVKEGYLEAIAETVKTEIPLLNSFLFQTRIPLHIKSDSLRLHSYILGMSGAGKSTLIKNIIYNLQKSSYKRRDKTIILIEPHGDVSGEVLQFCLNRGKYKKRLVYLDPFIRDTAMRLFDEDILGADYTFTINPFQVAPNTNEQAISYLTQELSSAIFEILESEATNQMLSVIESCIDVLLRKPDGTLSDLKMMMDDNKNQQLIDFGMQSPNSEVAAMIERFKTDGRLKATKSSIYYRLQSLIGNTAFRRALVGDSTVNLEREINNGSVILFNLSKSKMGKRSSPAFGKLIIALLQGLAMKRQDIPEQKRIETYCFIDEFSTYVTPTINNVMTEARKCRLYMTLANQVISQNMGKSTKRAVLGNSALKFASDNENDSLEVMAKQMGNIKPEQFNSLPKYSFLYHDKMNKKGGVNVLRVPPFLTNTSSPFFMKKEELKDVFKYLVFESGYYRKVEPIKDKATQQNKSNDNSYQPNFDE